MGNRIAEGCLVFFQHDRVVTEKRCGAGFIDFARSNAHRETVKQSIVCGQCIAVDEQKRNSSNDTGALVSIHKSMVAAYSENIGCCDFRMIRLAINLFVLRASQGRLKSILITKPLSAAVALQLFDVDCLNDASRKKTPVHSASFCKAT